MGDKKKKDLERNEEVLEETEEKVDTQTEISEEEEKKDEKDKKIEELQSQANEFKDKWLRNVAEFDNYKKRNAKLWQEAYNEGIASVIVKVLPVGDNLEWALSLGLDEKTENGIRGIKKKFEETLRAIEVEEINPIGEIFDPNVAEAVMQVDGGEGEQSETVKQVFEKGYKLKDKIIRYAKVSVIK